MIMLSLLMYRMLIYIFLLLSIVVISYNLFGTMCLISGRFYLLGWLQPLWFLQPSLHLFCSFTIARVSVLLSIWVTSWYCFILNRQVRGLMCSLLVWLGLHINFSKSDLCLTQTFCFLGVMLGYSLHISIFTS